MAPAASSLYAGARALEGLKTIVNILQDLSGDLPIPASTVINLVQRAITTLEEVRKNQDDCESLKMRLLELLPVVMMTIQRESTDTNGQLTLPADLKGNVERFQRSLENIEKEVAEVARVANSKRKRHRLTTIFWVRSHAATLQKCRDDLDWAMDVFKVSSQLSDAVRLWEMSKKVETLLTNQTHMSRNVEEVLAVQGQAFATTKTTLTNQFLEALPRAKYASFDCERPDKPSACLQGTRIAILKLISDWVADPGAPRFFWLNGIAGVGKTTVACTVARVMQELGLLGGQFCFSRRGDAELRNPALVFPTIAYQLARFDPEFGRRITAALERDTEAPYASLKQQLDRLIIEPLSRIKRDPTRVVVLVLDAFDECEARGAKEILQLLIAAMPRLPFFLKIFVTSRPEHHIRSVLLPASNLRITALHDIETSIVKGDILLYIRHRLQNLGKELDVDLPPDWVKESEIQLLADKAGNLFIHAATVIRFLLQGLDPRDQLELLLKIITSPTGHGSSITKPFADLDQLYQQILLALCNPEDDPTVAARLRLVLGSIILLQDLLPVDALERLIGLGVGRAANTLRFLHSVVLTPPPPDDCPRVFHPSFPDFLQDHSRCTSNQIWIDTEEHALQCLTLLNSRLHKGMLGKLSPTLLNSEVEDLANKVKDAFPPELQYACRYWASHLANVSRSNIELEAALELFASHSLLPWMEAMSWLGDTSLAIKCLEAANSWQSKFSKLSTTTTLLEDGYHLLVAHIPTIALGAQHIARSVLPFAPGNSALAARYLEYSDPSVKVLQGVDPEWSPCLMVWKGHSNSVTSIAYSPDGSRAASASDGQMVRLWDTTAGTCMATLGGHTQAITSVVFSPDGSALASGSWDNTIMTWDTTTGTCISVFQGHPGFCYTAAFPGDGSRLAFGYHDRIIALWDTITGTTITTFEGHSAPVTSVVFCPVRRNLASGSDDGVIRIWDMTGRCTSVLKGHSSKVTSIAFSPNGSRLASGCTSYPIRIWDVATGKSCFTYTGHSSRVNDLAFSPKGNRVASASNDRTIQVWDTATGEGRSIFRGHSDVVTSVAFSPDGSRLISGSRDETVRIWDAALNKPTVMSERHSDRVTSVAISKDGLRVVSVSFDHTARIWDATDGRCLKKLEGHSNRLKCVAFHPDGSHIATGSDDKTVRLWDSTSGECMATLTGHHKWVTSLAFSMDGSHLQSTDRSDATFLWHATTGKPAEEGSHNQFEDPAPIPFKISDGRLTRTNEGETQSLVCMLPPGTSAESIAWVGLGGERHRVAIGCENGTLFILEISFPSD